MFYRNYSVGLRIHCADRKKVYHSQAKIPSPKAILHGFLPVTVMVLNSYVLSLYLVFGYAAVHGYSNGCPVIRLFFAGVICGCVLNTILNHNLAKGPSFSKLPITQ